MHAKIKLEDAKLLCILHITYTGITVISRITDSHAAEISLLLGA